MLPQAMESTPEIWVLIFQHLAGDYTTLRNISLVSHEWRTLSLPPLLSIVDISSHNIERRLTEYEDAAVRPIVYSRHNARFRPQNLVPRQRAFLQLITDQPALAKYVQSFTWTLVWKNHWEEEDEEPLTGIDCETWNVFAKMLNVTHLDLASIHDIWEDEIVHKNPPYLFPKVVDLRLLGWMHRDLVRAIINSIDTTKLRCLKLDHLEDQGAMPGGYLLNYRIPERFAKSGHRGRIANDFGRMIDDDLFQRQEAGNAAVFPGPMWYPLRLLSDKSPDSLSLLRITVPHFEMNVDLRNYYTTFREAARLLGKTSRTLRSLVIIFVERRSLYIRGESECGTWRSRFDGTYRPWHIKLTAAFLKQILFALSDSTFPNLTRLTFEGFHQLESKAAGPDLGGTLDCIKKCRFKDVNFTGTSHIDDRHLFTGFYCTVPEFKEDVLRDS